LADLVVRHACEDVARLALRRRQQRLLLELVHVEANDVDADAEGATERSGFAPQPVERLILPRGPHGEVLSERDAEGGHQDGQGYEELPQDQHLLSLLRPTAVPSDRTAMPPHAVLGLHASSRIPASAMWVQATFVPRTGGRCGNAKVPWPCSRALPPGCPVVATTSSPPGDGNVRSAPASPRPRAPGASTLPAPRPPPDPNARSVRRWRVPDGPSTAGAPARWRNGAAIGTLPRRLGHRPRLRPRPSPRRAHPQSARAPPDGARHAVR